MTPSTTALQGTRRLADTSSAQPGVAAAQMSGANENPARHTAPARADVLRQALPRPGQSDGDIARGKKQLATGLHVANGGFIGLATYLLYKANTSGMPNDGSAYTPSQALHTVGGLVSLGLGSYARTCALKLEADADRVVQDHPPE